MVSLKYDPEVKALYFKVLEDKGKPTPVANTITLKEGTYLDISKDNKVIGLELLLPDLENENEEIANTLSKLKEIELTH